MTQPQTLNPTPQNTKPQTLSCEHTNISEEYETLKQLSSYLTEARPILEDMRIMLLRLYDRIFLSTRYIMYETARLEAMLPALEEKINAIDNHALAIRNQVKTILGTKIIPELDEQVELYMPSEEEHHRTSNLADALDVLERLAKQAMPDDVDDDISEQYAKVVVQFVSSVKCTRLLLAQLYRTVYRHASRIIVLTNQLEKMVKEEVSDRNVLKKSMLSLWSIRQSSNEILFELGSVITVAIFSGVNQ